MRTERLLFHTADGRDIDYLTAGEPDGLPLVVHGSTPRGLVLDTGLANAAAERGLRVVRAARPGYEGSSPWPGRIVADVEPDIAALLDELGADQYLSVGFSGGGPHSLACAALDAGRCLGAASVAAAHQVAPDGATGATRPS